MNHILLYTALAVMVIILSFSCNTPTSGPLEPAYMPSDSAKAFYLNDATDFAVDYIFASGSRDTASVIVPDSVLDRYLYPLSRLYDKRREIPLLDMLISVKYLHKSLNRSRSLIVQAETSFAWVQNVHKGIFPTGDRIVDSLSYLYGVRFRLPAIWGYAAYQSLDTDQPPLNNRALGRAFLRAPGVSVTEPNTYYSFYSALAVTPGVSGTIIRFYEGYGDCPAGCFGYHAWSFSVSPGYEITYLGYEP